MANIASQKKRNRQNEKRSVRNKTVRSEMKTRVKAAGVAAAAAADDKAEKMSAAQKRVDKAARKGVIHKNAAARKVSRLMKKANAAAAS